MSNEIRTLTEEEMEIIAGGSSEGVKHYKHIKTLIELGYDRNARNYYRLYAMEIEEKLRQALRREFEKKFGYPIEGDER